jgi:hypothetical protein
MSTVYHKLVDGNLTQDWSNSSLITSSNDWSNVPSIQGFSTVEGAATGADPRSLTGDSSNPDVAANVFTSPSQYNPNTGQHGGLTEFQDFGIMGLAGGVNAAAPNMVFYLDTTGVNSPIQVSFDVQDLDGSSRNAQEQLNVQYRIGETGNWTNVPDGYLADVTSANSTPTTHVHLTLPSDAMGQPELQVRVMTTDSDLRDEWVGIDNIVVACFVRGTLIATPEGDVSIETLAIGDQVCTQDGELRAIKWIGRRAFSTKFLKQDSPVTPVVVRANAFAVGVPYRDLRVSPEHAFFIDGVLIPAIHLVNGRTIFQELAGETVEYYHIEVEGQAIVLAQGAPAETYVNHDNRRMFANWREYEWLYGPDQPALNQDQEFARIYPCVTKGPQFELIYSRLSGVDGFERLVS